MKCSTCARELPDGAAFCPACATPVDFSSTPTVTRVDSPAARAVRAGYDEHADREAGAAPPSPRGGSGPRHTPASHGSDFGYEARYVPGTTLLAEPTILVIFVILVATIFGFYTSTRGKPLFGGISLDS
jgi:hypothetical protein